MADEHDNRPDPYELLEAIKEQEEKDLTGKLKIFFGMCAGVGKTYSMLEAAHKAKQDGVDVVIGVVETHKRLETEELTQGLEIVHLNEISYRGTNFKEMDLDAILKRHPELVIVDELAHTNIPGSRHTKRYQDILEILNHGINVYTTLNVQHLDSRSETVKQITGTIIRETVPDSIFERADDIELIDITPDKLLQRLSEGKVYTPERSKTAIENFFRKGNLTALREMALRLTAERVDWELRDYLNEKKISDTWKSSLRLMVAIGPSPYSADLIRWTRRLAYSMEATWIAVYIETEHGVTDKNKDLLLKNFNLARELGAEIITSTDTDIIKGLVRVAKENNITQIIVGKSRNASINTFLFGRDKIRKLINSSGDIDVYVVSGNWEKSRVFAKPNFAFTSGFKQYLICSGIVGSIALACFNIDENIGYQTVSLIFLLVLSFLPLFNFGSGPILWAAFLSALSWDFFFIPPKYTFHVSKVEDTLMLIVYFIVAIVTGVLSARIRKQEKFVRQREQKTSALYNLTRELFEANSIDAITEIVINNLTASFNCKVIVVYSNLENKLSGQPHALSTGALNETEWGYAYWVFKNRQKAGRFTDTIPSASATYYPLIGRTRTFGVIGIIPNDNEQMSFDLQNLFDTFLKQIATAIEREYLNEITKEALVISESEKLYKTLFNSISHELKTPLTTIITASSGLDSNESNNNNPLIASLSHEIKIAAERLNRLVENFLDMTRLESGVIKLKLDWYDVKDLFEGITAKLMAESPGSGIKVFYENEIKVFKFDYVLLEQALLNVIRNSILYSPDNSDIVININEENNQYCKIKILDNGPGFPPDAISKIFQKFYRVPGTKTGGTGLGLSIAKGFIDAHNGTIEVDNRSEGGAQFTIKIPMS